jgi:CHAT domain-containing protein
MKVLVSGQSGVAVLNRGEHWYVIRPPHYDLSESRYSSAIRLLDGSTDVKEIHDTSPESIRLELETAVAKDTALQYTLVLLEAGVNRELQESVLNRLEKLLLVPDVPEFILNRLYAAPLQPSSMNHAHALLAKHEHYSISAILKRVLNDQEPIGRLRSAWVSVSADLFGSTNEKDRFFLSAVEQGLARRLTQEPGRVLSQSDGAIGEMNEIVRNWAEAAGIGPDILADDPSRVPHFDLIRSALSQEPVQRSKVLKIRISAVFQQLKQNFDVLLNVERGRLADSKAVAESTIATYHDRLIYQLRDQFTATLRRCGLRVNMDQLQLFENLAEQLAKFKKELENREFDERYKEHLLDSADRAFQRVTEQLGDLAAHALDSYDEENARRQATEADQNLRYESVATSGNEELKAKDVAVLRVWRESPDESQLSLQLSTTRHSLEQPKVTSRTRVDENLIIESRRLLAEAIHHAGEFGANKNLIAKLGRLLYDALLPPLRLDLDKVRTDLSQLHIPLLVSVDDLRLPWELLHDHDDFLGMKFSIARDFTQSFARSDPPESVQKPRCLMIVDPAGDEAHLARPEAALECKRVRNWLENHGVECHYLEAKQASLAGVLRRLKSQPYDILHYVGHTAQEPQIDAYALRLHGNEVLSAEDIRYMNRSVPIIFLDTLSGDAGPRDGRDVQALANSFAGAGARAVIGPQFEIQGEQVGGFAESFYRSALGGIPLGEAMRVARGESMERTDSGGAWARFVMYGDPWFIPNVSHASSSHTTFTTIPNKRPYDVFVCYNAEDRASVRPIVEQLRAAGIAPWFDVDELGPGTNWQRAIEGHVRGMSAAVVFLGGNAVGPGHWGEVEAVLRNFLSHGGLVVPVLLPGASTDADIPRFLSDLAPVDLRSSSTRQVRRLILAIRREGPLSRERSSEFSTPSEKPRQPTELQLELVRRKVAGLKCSTAALTEAFQGVVAELQGSAFGPELPETQVAALIGVLCLTQDLALSTSQVLAHTRSVWQMLPAVATKDKPVERAFECAIAYGCGWGRTLQSGHESNPTQIWPAAFEWISLEMMAAIRRANSWLSRIVLTNGPGMSDLQEAIGLSAVTLTWAVVRPVDRIELSPHEKVVIQPSLDGMHLDQPLGREVVPPGGLRTYSIESGLGVLDANAVTEAIPEGTRLTLRSLDFEGMWIRFGAGAKLGKVLRIRPGASGILSGVRSPFAIHTWHCGCGTLACPARHRLTSWQPGSISLKGFLDSAVNGRRWPLASGSFVAGMYYPYLLRQHHLRYVPVALPMPEAEENTGSVALKMHDRLIVSDRESLFAPMQLFRCQNCQVLRREGTEPCSRCGSRSSGVRPITVWYDRTFGDRTDIQVE